MSFYSSVCKTIQEVKPKCRIKFISYRNLNSIYDLSPGIYNIHIEDFPSRNVFETFKSKKSDIGSILSKAPVGVLLNLELSIPENVTDISRTFKNCSCIRSMTITSAPSVKRAAQLFKHCKNLLSVNLSGLTAVEDTFEIFEDCPSLREVYNLSRLKKIGTLIRTRVGSLTFIDKEEELENLKTFIYDKYTSSLIKSNAFKFKTEDAFIKDKIDVLESVSKRLYFMNNYNGLFE